jgi:hypothetical protein
LIGATPQTDIAAAQTADLRKSLFIQTSQALVKEALSDRFKIASTNLPAGRQTIAPIVKTRTSFDLQPLIL